jgi:hypothetical protein
MRAMPLSTISKYSAQPYNQVQLRCSASDTVRLVTSPALQHGCNFNIVQECRHTADIHGKFIRGCAMPLAHVLLNKTHVCFNKPPATQVQAPPTALLHNNSNTTPDCYVTGVPMYELRLGTAVDATPHPWNKIPLHLPTTTPPHPKSAVTQHHTTIKLPQKISQSYEPRSNTESNP